MTPITLRTLQLAGVALCIIAVIVSATVFPTLAPPTFLAATVAMLVIAFWIHRGQFGVEEYERNTMKYTLRNSASLIVFILAVLGIVGFYYFSQHNSYNPGPALPSISVPTVGGGLNNVAKNAVSRVKELMRTGSIDM
jgi:uncharacterized membrane protein (DUF4010 family)